MVRIVKWSLALVLIVLLSAAAFEAFAGNIKVQTRAMNATASHEPDFHAPRTLARTIGVLEGKMGNRRLPRQAIEKLTTMDERELKLITKLCDRIAQTGEKPGTDVAVLLVATLIVLS
jgi:hypothetical protein